MDSMPTGGLGAMPTGSIPGMQNMTTMSTMGDMDLTCKISMLWNWYTIDSCFLSRSWHIRSKGAFAGACIGAILLVIALEALRRAGRDYESFILRRARLRHMYLSGPSSGAPAGQGVKAKFQKIISGAQGNSTAHYNDGPSGDDLITPVKNSSLRPKTSHENNGLSQKDSIPGVDKTSHNIGRANFGPYRPSPMEQLIRALLHMLQFAVAYFVMLLAMYYNGYIIICIFIGAFLGSLVFSWEPVSLSRESDATTVTKCCG
ncbi:uncharacterized protein N7484_000569 [Penicillium longicatenatum]|uniref:uncharacterized protein n=1 Tax=Penicillium longicatenatum TaxID=1561947 RepID=UPI002546BCA0|nr:uncharacterized protein N7484_000569 [Penicillium longicatenatum]KAJ5661197.1 hypothetical protein N7484_000569 [Penicillium longicatenatum]